MTPPLPASTPADPTPTSRSALSDDELVVLARDGDADAYGELWSRHSGIGLAIARRYFDVADPDDIVAESFARILATLKRGGGPRAGFRPYLITTIGNVARRWATRSKEGASDELDLLEDPRTVDDPVVASTEREFALEAFKSLPERWQAVLWYSAVEGMGPSEIAGYLGMTPNATAVLAHRARAGLRTAWVQAHLNDASLPADCRWTAGRLGRRATGSLNHREQEQVKAHLATCLGCRSRARELDMVSSRLAVVLVPALLGLGIPFLDDGSEAVAATTPIVAPGAVAPIWITTMLGAGTAATLVAALLLGTSAPVTTAAAAEETPRARDLVVEPPVAAPPIAAPPLAPPVGPGPTTPAPGPPATSAPAATPGPRPTEPARPDPVVTPPAPAAPIITMAIDPFALTPPTLSGTGQLAARVVVVDELGTVLSDVPVNADGTWLTGTLESLSPAAASVEIYQVDPQGRRSPSVSLPLAARPLSAGVVTPLAPDWHITGDEYTPLTLNLHGWPGATIAIEHLNSPYAQEPRFPATVTLDGEGLACLTIPAPWSGTHSVTVRYVDSGRVSSGTSGFSVWVPWWQD